MTAFSSHLAAFTAAHAAVSDVHEGLCDRPEYARLRAALSRLDAESLRHLSVVAQELFLEVSLFAMSKIGHICDYVDVDGTTNGTCHLPGTHVGRCWVCKETALDCDHVDFPSIVCEFADCTAHPRNRRGGVPEGFSSFSSFSQKPEVR
jgi:hypothetical protein